MNNKKNKTLMLNTLLLVFCVVVIALFCFGPNTKVDKVEVLQKYNIVFDSTGGSTIADLKIEKGKKIDQPAAPTRDGYIFVGWMLDDELYDFSNGVTGDITLKAKWELMLPDVNYFTISFSTSGGTEITPITVQEGTTGDIPIPPKREGFEFVEWQLNGLTYDFTKSVFEDITLVAVWEVVEESEEPEEEEKKTFTVKFNLNGGSGSFKDLKVEDGKTAKKPTASPTKSGYKFLGWYLDGKAYNFSSKVTKNITLIAQWEKIVVEAKKFKVTFYDSNNKSCGVVEVVEGKTASVPRNCNITKNGTTLKGWTTTKNINKTDFDPGKSPVTSDLSVYPIYHVYKLTCSTDGIGDELTKYDCKLTITQDGKVINPTAMYLGGEKLDVYVVNFNLDWPQIDSVTFDYANNSNLVAKK